MAANTQRKTFFILALALSLVVALAAVILDQELRDRLGTNYYVIGFAIIGCVLMVLVGYVWDRALLQRLKALRTNAPFASLSSPKDDTDRDDIISLARNIERAPAVAECKARYPE